MLLGVVAVAAEAEAFLGRRGDTRFQYDDDAGPNRKEVRTRVDRTRHRVQVRRGYRVERARGADRRRRIGRDRNSSSSAGTRRYSEFIVTCKCDGRGRQEPWPTRRRVAAG